MSATARKRAPLPDDIRALKGQRPIVSLTAYTTPMAALMDAHCDFVLVGDSLGMVQHGLTSTLPVTLRMMEMHGRAVARGLSRAMMVVDMPFGSYEEGPQQAFRNAARLMARTGAAAVKLEGGTEMAGTIAFLVKRGVPVMAHLGLTPQAINTLGGYKVQGRGEAADALVAEAAAVEAAGAFSVVLEKVPSTLAERISGALSIPTIGIGAGPGCDGQILVVDDMLGLFTAFRPKFVKRYAELGAEAGRAVAAYAEEVRARSFPAPEHCFADQPGTGKVTGPASAPGTDPPDEGAAAPATDPSDLVLRDRSTLRDRVDAWHRAGEVVGVVPTMGALHEGHLSLVRAARAECDRVIVTIFVNPTQFNNPADLDSYPRTEEDDARKLAPLGVDAIYVPDVAQVYPDGFASTVSVTGLTDVLCGAHRPGHFDGVATVVAKLFGQTRADRAYFGRKDWQQLQVVRRMARDLDLGTRVIGCPTVREEDGLAMSSRNLRLSPAARATAPNLGRVLAEMAGALRGGAAMTTIEAQARADLAAAGFAEVEYLELRDATSLEARDHAEGETRLFVAAWLDGVRLIDNVAVSGSGADDTGTGQG